MSRVVLGGKGDCWDGMFGRHRLSLRNAEFLRAGKTAY